MSLHTLSRHVRLAVRGEILMIQAKLAFVLRRTGIIVLALLFAGLGLVFLNIGVFAWLSPQWGPVWTPVGLGLINLGLAAVALAVAAFSRPGADMALAEEIRNMAAEQAEGEIRSASMFGALGGERSALAGLLVPALSAVIGGLARRRKEKA